MNTKRTKYKKRGTGGGVSIQPPAAPVSRVTTKAEMLAQVGRAPTASGPKPKRRVDSRIDRKRNFTDGIDDFELELHRHGVNFQDLYDAAQEFAKGKTTPYYKLADAVVRWWCSLPLGPRKIVWVDPASGYSERNVPKFSTIEGRQLVERGLAGARWVYSRVDLLRARTWRARMLGLTVAERLRVPAELGEERLDWSQFRDN